MLFAPSSQTNSSLQRVTSDDWNRWRDHRAALKSGRSGVAVRMAAMKSEGRKMKSERPPERQLALWREMREYTRDD